MDTVENKLEKYSKKLYREQLGFDKCNTKMTTLQSKLSKEIEELEKELKRLDREHIE